MSGPLKMIGDRAEWLGDLLSRAVEHMHLLTDSDQRFIIGTRERYYKFLSHTAVSDKQMAWLEDIERRLEEAGAEAELYRDDQHDDYGGMVPVDQYIKGQPR